MEPPRGTETGVSDCHLNSARALVKLSGDIAAIPHNPPKTGYKAANAYGAKPVFTGETTNQFFQKGVQTAGEGSGANTKKKLMPYYANASRNRPKESMENIAGSRFGPHPTIKTEQYRGSSRVYLGDGDPESRRAWKTTNQVFAECTQMRDVTGLGNAGISSDVAKRMHKKQGIYT